MSALAANDQGLVSLHIEENQTSYFACDLGSCKAVIVNPKQSCSGNEIQLISKRYWLALRLLPIDNSLGVLWRCPDFHSFGRWMTRTCMCYYQAREEYCQHAVAALVSDKLPDSSVGNHPSMFTVSEKHQLQRDTSAE